MKKFLAFLLIAIVACEAVEDLDLNDILDWLKNSGIYDEVKSKLVDAGKQIAIDFCSNYLSRSTCESAVDVLANMLGL